MKLCLTFASILDYLHSHQMALSTHVRDDVDGLARKLLISNSSPTTLMLGPFDLARDDNNSTLGRRDIFLAPQICNKFLGDAEKVLKDRLKVVHRHCVENTPSLQPNATALSRAYKAIYLALASEPTLTD